MSTCSPQPTGRLRTAVRGGVGVLLIAAVATVFVYRDAVNPEVARGMLDSLGPWAGPGFVVLYAAAAVLVVPCFPLTLAAGAMFGPVVGTLLNLAGATLGATAAFNVSRYLVGDWLRGRTSGRLERIVRGVESNGWQYVAFTRLVPVFPYILLNYAYGVTRIRGTHYVLASCVAMIPAAAVCAFAGYAGRRLVFAVEGPWAFVATGGGGGGAVAVGWWWQGE